jgi:hypothetical protein
MVAEGMGVGEGVSVGSGVAVVVAVALAIAVDVDVSGGGWVGSGVAACALHPAANRAMATSQSILRRRISKF